MVDFLCFHLNITSYNCFYYTNERIHSFFLISFGLCSMSMRSPSFTKPLLFGEQFCEPARTYICFYQTNMITKQNLLHKLLEVNYLFDLYLLRASSLLSSLVGSKTPVSKFTLETCFFNSPSPTFTRSSKFFFVALSTEVTSPLSVSS